MGTAIQNRKVEKPAATKDTLPQSNKWRFIFGVALWSCLVFAVLNFFLWKVAGEEKGASKDLWNGTGSIDLAIDGLAALKTRPNVVLLGSSLMMYPFWAMDKERDAKIGDIFHHHFSHAMEDRMVEEKLSNNQKNPTVYSLAIFGQMSSDAYIYVDEFLKGDKKPEWLVLGIAPRDFSDYDLPSPTATYTFQRLVGLANFDRYASLYLPTWQGRTDFLMNHICFFYARRWRLQKEFDKAINKAYAFCGFAQPQSQAKSAENTAGFMLSGSEDERFANSLNEYKRRYRYIGDRDLTVQMGFLDRLLAVSHERNIKVILINMPLTQMNRQLLPEGFYDHFGEQISTMAKSHNANFLNLGASKEFDRGDFWDTTHLNHSGGRKLLKHILPIMSDSKNIQNAD